MKIRFFLLIALTAGNFSSCSEKGEGEEFNASSLPAGIYSLHVYDGAGSTTKIKHIIVER